MEVSRRGALLGALGVAGVSASGAVAMPIGTDRYLATQNELFALVRRVNDLREATAGLPQAQFHALKVKHFVPHAEKWVISLLERFPNFEYSERAAVQVAACFDRLIVVPEVQYMQAMKDTAVGVMFVKTALANYRLPFVTLHMPSFNLLVERYRDIILGERSWRRLDRETVLKHIDPRIINRERFEELA